MGQGQSQPADSSANDSSSRRRSLLIRSANRPSSPEDGHRNLLQRESSALLYSRPRSQGLDTIQDARFRESIARLHQLATRNYGREPAGADQDEDHTRTGRSILTRTRSGFRDMISRGGTLRRRHHNRDDALLPDTSEHTDGDLDHERDTGETGEYYPPRLPSIDVTSTFDTHPFSTADEVEHPPTSSHSSRRPNLRFNPLRADRSLRHLTSSLRRRRSPHRSDAVRRGVAGGSEDQATMLSRLLSVAAAATAATLMGDDRQALSEARSLTGSSGFGDLGGSASEDGSFEGFLRALQNGRIASALRQGGDGEESAREGPLNFFRMFRFGPSAAPENGNDPDNAADTGGGTDGRMVPIIIVGIRSISPNSGSGSGAGSGSAADELPPFIDALGHFPNPLPAHALGTHSHDSIDSILRPPHNGTSFRHRRRASMGGFGMGRSRINDRLDDQRDHRSPDRQRERPWSMASASSNHDPRPPPATPASPSSELSRISSRNSTPVHSRPPSFVATDSRRNSALHRVPVGSPLSAHTEESVSLHSAHSSDNLLSSLPDSRPFRLHSHRRSDTAPNIHYPRFASGHPRRNGVVEPDNLPPLSRSSTSNDSNRGNDARNGDSRSWIIYVLGGSYPENHPILTTPSLFTENPTYEDMMLLSALLGPAKAPVATDEDVEAAGGIYILESQDSAKTARLVAAAIDGDERVELDLGQRCLVCLCDFEAREVGRKLVKCNHLFHKECIDQWLTQGRNSCPLCRGQGVDEKTEMDATPAVTNPSEVNNTGGRST